MINSSVLNFLMLYVQEKPETYPSLVLIRFDVWANS